MQDLTPVPCREVMPVVRKHAARLDLIEPTWGLFPHVIPRERLNLRPPTLAVLEEMQDELLHALVPCGVKAGARAAAAIVDGYPQRDLTSATYAEHLTMRLAACPIDLLPAVIAAAIDASPDFRPGAGRVAALVNERVAKRRGLLLRVQAAIRYRTWLAEQEALEEQARSEAAATLARLTARSLHIPPVPSSHPAPPPPPESARTPKAAVLSGDALAQARRMNGASHA